MFRRIAVAWFLLMLVCGNVSAQKVMKVSDTYVHRASTNISPDQARLNAVEQAKLHIIAQNLGTVVGMSSTSVTTGSNGNSKSQFTSFAETDVKGEWIETIGEPQIDIKFDGCWQVVTVKIKGIIREIVSAGIDVTARVLRNGTDENAETDIFRDGDDLFVSFLSPVNGYLTIYMYDMENVVRLLPLANSADGAQKIEAAHPYVFFKGVKTVDGIRSRYHMTAQTESDINRIYFVFSPRPFSHPNDNNIGGFPVLSFNNFQSWLSRARKSDYNMMVIPKEIIIKK